MYNTKLLLKILDAACDELVFVFAEKEDKEAIGKIRDFQTYIHIKIKDL